MARLLTLVATNCVVLSMGVAPAAPIPVAPPPREVVYYFPTTIGAKWTYRYSDGETATFEVTSAHRDGNAWVIGTSELDAAGRASMYQTVEVSARGVFRLESVVRTSTTDGRGGTARTQEMVPDVPPVCLLKLPASPGETLAKLGPATYKTGREEVVTVPAGVFKAVRVDYEQAGVGGGPAVRGRTWYAPGVGAVKWVLDGGSESVMKTYTAGKR